MLGVLIASLIPIQAIAQDLSGWSDKTVCRLLSTNAENTDYLEEAVSRNLECFLGTKTSTRKDDKSTAFDGDYPFVLSRFNPSEGVRGIGSGILVIQNGIITVSPKDRFLDTSATKYYDTLKGRIDKRGKTSITFDVNPLHGKGSPSPASFSGNITNLQIKGASKNDDYFELIITLSADTSSMTSDGLTMTASKHSGYGSHSNFFGQKKNNFQLITDSAKARRGEKYQRFEVADGDCFAADDWNDCEMDRERVEFTATPMQKPNGNQCFAFSIMLDESFQSASPTNTSLGQIHQRGGPTGTMQGLKSNPPIIQFDVHNHVYAMNWHVLSGSATNVIDSSAYYELVPINEMKGQWTDISFCLDFAKHNMAVWVNGTKKVNINKPPINVNFIPSAIYFKHGIYRSFVSKYKASSGTGAMPTQIVYYDEVRRGVSINEVDFNINPGLETVD
tara:strand:+ start:678 stop:2021 length:1344 start_codon:yes stop_codon:yes gene_type:complete